MRKILLTLTAILMLSFSSPIRAGGADVSAVEEDMLSVISTDQLESSVTKVVLNDQLQSDSTVSVILEKRTDIDIGDQKLINTIYKLQNKGGVQEFYLIESNKLLKVPWTISKEDLKYKNYSSKNSNVDFNKLE